MYNAPVNNKQNTNMYDYRHIIPSKLRTFALNIIEDGKILRTIGERVLPNEFRESLNNGYIHFDANHGAWEEIIPDIKDARDKNEKVEIIVENLVKKYVKDFYTIEGVDEPVVNLYMGEHPGEWGVSIVRQRTEKDKRQMVVTFTVALDSTALMFPNVYCS